jgi:hypothetical protein
MARTAPGLVVVLATLLLAAPAADAGARGCKGRKACNARAEKPRKPANGTGWIGGIYNGGPGDPIIAPLPSLPG